MNNVTQHQLDRLDAKLKEQLIEAYLAGLEGRNHSAGDTANYLTRYAVSLLKLETESTASDTTSKDDDLDMLLLEARTDEYGDSGNYNAEKLKQLIKQYGIQERIDEHSLWKPVAEEIVTKDGVYRAVNFLNQRAQELTALKDKQETER